MKPIRARPTTGGTLLGDGSVTVDEAAAAELLRRAVELAARNDLTGDDLGAVFQLAPKLADRFPEFQVQATVASRPTKWGPIRLWLLWHDVMAIRTAEDCSERDAVRRLIRQGAPYDAEAVGTVLRRFQQAKGSPMAAGWARVVQAQGWAAYLAAVAPLYARRDELLACEDECARKGLV